jgi:2-C-methyl-D-erythritol 2,4-cyclodiphosphate synthase
VVPLPATAFARPFGEFSYGTAERACYIPARVVPNLPPRYNPRSTEIHPGAPTTTNLRIGIGEDSHRLTPGGPLRLGGIDVPHDQQLIGHSDADVLLHAVTDAILGAAALPDIGRMFPNTDETNRDRDSAEMLAAAAVNVAETGFRIVNLDCVVHAERPKLADYQDAIRHRIAGILRLNPNQIGLKAKTGEGVGPVGQGQVIEARCIALLESDT